MKHFPNARVAGVALHFSCYAITRPAIANERLKRNGEGGQVVLQLKSAWRDGATHIKMSPLEFMQLRLRWCRDRACI